MAAYVRKNSETHLQKMQDNVQYSYEYWRKNNERFHEFVTVIFKTSLSPADKSVLQELQKPQMQFNVLEAYISRLCGEFSKMDPAFSVRAADGVQLADPRVIELVEAHMKATFMGGDKDSLSYKLYRDLLAGGFSVAKIWTDYANERSFDQKIYVDRAFDPTMCGFDPMAQQSHKGDGRWAYELFPKSVDEAKELFGSDVVKDVSFTANFKGFQWAYRNQTEEIILFCEYFEKVRRKTKILKLSNGKVVTEREYEDFMSQWESSGFIEQVPQPIKSRMADVEFIEKYIMTGNKIVDHEKTNFKYFPLVFFDGNSIIIQQKEGNTVEQMTRPYVYHAIDAQKMKNFAGQSWCNEVENLVQHKWVAPIEAIPDNADYQYAYTMPQKATILLYNQWKDNDPQRQINPPREIQRTPMPPEIAQAFQVADETIQRILGSYDAQQGINESDMSGVAIMQGAMQSNSAAMPYLTGFIQGWNRLGEVYLDLLPKYYVTPRTIPVILPDGRREYYEINKPGNIGFDYDTSALEVQVQAGVNYAVQKQVAMKVLLGLMQASEQFNQFMNTEGLEVLLDNIDIRGVDRLKIMAGEWMEQQKQAQQAAMQAQQNQPNPMELMQAQVQVEQAKVQQKAQEAEQRAQVELTKIAADDAVRNKEADIKMIEAMGKLEMMGIDADLKAQKTEAEMARSAVDMAISAAAHHNETRDMDHRHQQENERGRQEKVDAES